MKTSEIALHPLCSLFPRMAGAEFDALVSDIKANGLREPIIVHDGMILDGGNRYRACLEAGAEPATMKFGGGNLVDYVLSANLHRRHLSAGQQAAIVSSCQNWATAHPPHRTPLETKEKEPGKITGLSKQTVILPLDTVADRASVSGASDKTQRNADKVAKADPELAKAVGRGETTLPKAIEKITGKRTKPRTPTDFRSEEQKALDADIGLQLEICHDGLDTMLAENESLRNQVAAMLFTGTDEARKEYQNRLTELTAENNKLNMLNTALTNARDTAMMRADSMIGQVRYQAKKMKKAGIQ